MTGFPPRPDPGRVARQAQALQLTALTLPVLAALLLRGIPFLGVVLVALSVALGWEICFAVLRDRRVTGEGVVPALIVAVMLPATVPLWHLALSLSLGLVLGALVFGGRGFGFLSPAAAALALLLISFPGSLLSDTGGWIAGATLPGLALLLWTGLVSWRVALGFVGLCLAGGIGVDAAPALVFGLCFLVGDPFGAAVTAPGRWLHGAVTGGLVGYLGAEGASALVFAVLLGNVAAPLIDQAVIATDVARRRRRSRHG